MESPEQVEDYARKLLREISMNENRFFEDFGFPRKELLKRLGHGNLLIEETRGLPQCIEHLKLRGKITVSPRIGTGGRRYYSHRNFRYVFIAIFVEDWQNSRFRQICREQ